MSPFLTLNKVEVSEKQENVSRRNAQILQVRSRGIPLTERWKPAVDFLRYADSKSKSGSTWQWFSTLIPQIM